MIRIPRVINTGHIPLRPASVIRGQRLQYKGARRRCQQGFTLLEVVIAIALTALIGIAVAALVSQLVDSRDQLARSQPHVSDSRFMRLLSRRLAGLTPRALHIQGQAQLNQALDYEPSPHRLSWVSADDWPLPVGDHYTRLRRQQLHWQARQQRLVLSSNGLLDAINPLQWQTVAQLEHVTQFDIAFYDGARWRPTPSATTQGVRLNWRRAGQDQVMLVRLPDTAP
ncbi:PulJ/GspJ family protein [Terasakiispira papahanaumokuakeensis]|uniref:PulJ/GspJ family protein n=1 Tax=Terasakiispira papahanaumokuakeensis TaxID=197479 RepID=UPI001586C7E0|nr:prepilin-type N-terminal cleavage/methylation domain-containing protein [Terasakiispira papahanaumokuakeensis]